jgi:hypothetical protein
MNLRPLNKGINFRSEVFNLLRFTFHPLDLKNISRNKIKRIPSELVCFSFGKIEKEAVVFKHSFTKRLLKNLLTLLSLSK